MRTVIGRLEKNALTKIGIILLLAIVLVCAAYGWHEYEVFFEVPAARLAANSFYPEMPPDLHHHYLQIPLDHENKALGNFTAFYILSPGFSAREDVVFWLFDNQQEQVVHFEDASLEFFGQPIAYMPYLSMPDPSVKRKTGFLMPYRSATELPPNTT